LNIFGGKKTTKKGKKEVASKQEKKRNHHNKSQMESGVSAYELERLRNIERNQKMLEELQIKQTQLEIDAMKAKKLSKVSPPKEKKPKNQSKPTRKSPRNEGKTLCLKDDVQIIWDTANKIIKKPKIEEELPKYRSSDAGYRIIGATKQLFFFFPFLMFFSFLFLLFLFLGGRIYDSVNGVTCHW
jgi:hypothetical protein